MAYLQESGKFKVNMEIIYNSLLLISNEEMLIWVEITSALEQE